jgi:hypothetical protein
MVTFLGSQGGILGSALDAMNLHWDLLELSAPFHYLKVDEPAHDQCHAIINQNPNISLV